jgi:L-fuconolactonase
MTRIDSHHHFWKYDPAEYSWISESMSILRQDYLPELLREEAHAGGVSGVVSVQARQSVEETEWLVKFAQQYDIVRGVVGWAPLAEDGVQALLESWTHFGWLKSVRHVVQDEPVGFFDASDFNRGVDHLRRYDLAYDILIYARQLPETIAFVDRHPNVRFVLDHIAKPTIEKSKFDDEWGKNLRELAKRENVACKFSGVATEVRDESWDVQLVQPYWDVTWDAFGPDRLMFGSDWPVCLLKTSCARWVQTCENLVSRCSKDEQANFWHLTASNWYQL